MTQLCHSLIARFLCCACCMRSGWRWQRKKSSKLESTAPMGCRFATNGATTDGSGHEKPHRGPHEVSPNAQTDPDSASPAPCCMLVPYEGGSSDILRVSRSWQFGSLAEQAKFPTTAANSCRLEYEEDRKSSEPSRSKPPRQSRRHRPGSMSRQTSKGVSQILSTLRDSFGSVSV